MRQPHAVGFALAVLLLWTLAAVPPGRAEDGRSPNGQDVSFEETSSASFEAVRKGLLWLSTRQSPNGSFSSGQYPVAVTSLATLAFMADGNVPGRGRYAEQVDKGLKYLLDCAQRNKSGFITEPGTMQSRMHGHGFATLALVEAFGMTHNTLPIETGELKLTIDRAIERIERAQTKLGGWGYEPQPTSDEASVTICCVQALRAARNAGFTVDKKVVEKGIQYIKKCKNKDGSYRYSLSMGVSNSSFALTAGAVASLAFLGEYDCEEYRAGVEYMNRFRPPRVRDGGHYFYENFYAVLAMYYAGGKDWAEWYPPLRDEIVKLQKADGSWHMELSAEYCTAFGCLMLEVPFRYLPIYQR